ncbi:hypothetical protein BZA77DRAFT_296472 [Pyronema omphalodes]|nr:hypothetical protein BZA77DRAFT_296472 [Pyronema omphalodes]
MFSSFSFYYAKNASSCFLFLLRCVSRLLRVLTGWIGAPKIDVSSTSSLSFSTSVNPNLEYYLPQRRNRCLCLDDARSGLRRYRKVPKAATSTPEPSTVCSFVYKVNKEQNFRVVSILRLSVAWCCGARDSSMDDDVSFLGVKGLRSGSFRRPGF